MSYLLDTNVVSEPTKRSPDSNLLRWYERVSPQDLFISALVVGEVQQGIERRRRRDPDKASELQGWLDGMRLDFGERMLPVTDVIAARWGRLMVPETLPIIDGLMAATALEHGLTMVTRNVAHFERTGVPVFNPFEP